MNKKYKNNLWKPFSKQQYKWAFKESSVMGLVRELSRDLHRIHERIWKGYCSYDLYSIFDWFLVIMPSMLEEFRDHLHGYPYSEQSSEHSLSENKNSTDDDEGMKAWKGKLNQLIFLLREADENSCTKKNQHEEEYYATSKEFEDKYGLFGEKLLTEEEKKEARRTGCTKLYLPEDVDEYKPISDKFFEEERKLSEYRAECKDKAFVLFSEVFYDLWD